MWLSKVTSNPQYPNYWVSRNNFQLINISEARALRWVSDWVKRQKLVIEFFLYQDIPAKKPQPKQQQKNPQMDNFCWIFLLSAFQHFTWDTVPMLTVREGKAEDTTSKCDLDPVNPYFRQYPKCFYGSFEHSRTCKILLPYF